VSCQSLLEHVTPHLISVIPLSRAVRYTLADPCQRASTLADTLSATGTGGTVKICTVFVITLLAFSAAANAAVFRFDTDPFQGSTALTTPGRQVVGGEASIAFNIATDVFSLESTVFGTGSQLQFANGLVGNLPTSNVNTVVLQTFDNDNNTATPFAAGNAADLIADRLASGGPGFFIYFNQGLDLPRLVFSTNLNDPTADLKILFRMTNLNGQAGRDAFPQFTAANFQITTVPEPSTMFMIMSAGVFAACRFASRRRRTRV
jgi:hypothetical protein